MSNVAGTEDGLRARKRAATASALQLAALTLAVEHGYENITVEMISEACMVSPRTFFNYFGSKEGAILGASPPEPSDEARDAFIRSSSRDVLTELVTMITSAMTGEELNADVFSLRREVISRHPELLNKLITRMAEQESKLIDLIMQRFASQGRTPENTPDLENEARMVIALVVSVMRYTAREWFDKRSAVGLQELLHSAVALIHRITRDRPPE